MLSDLEELLEAASKEPWVYEADENGPARILNVGSFPCCESWGGNLQERYALGRANARLAALAPTLARKVLDQSSAGKELAEALGQRSAKLHYLDHIIVTPEPFPLSGASPHTVKWEVCPRSPCRDDRAALDRWNTLGEEEERDEAY